MKNITLGMALIFGSAVALSTACGDDGDEGADEPAAGKGGSSAGTTAKGGSSGSSGTTGKGGTTGGGGEPTTGGGGEPN
ncbi:MAG TPA: hypothetical protein VM686_34165, partial [Polyangiaceae bacterium]|nr:hypothetical protein [Polyangiaceae bacterium]